jgi:hypothetical protein
MSLIEQQGAAALNNLEGCPDMPPLCIAASHNDVSALTCLLAAGADINAVPPSTGQNALYYAARAHAVDALRVLLAAPNVSVTHDNFNRECVLHGLFANDANTDADAAAATASLAALRLLVESRADINHRDSWFQRSALHLAVTSHSQQQRQWCGALPLLARAGARPGLRAAAGSAAELAVESRDAVALAALALSFPAVDWTASGTPAPVAATAAIAGAHAAADRDAVAEGRYDPKGRVAAFLAELGADGWASALEAAAAELDAGAAITGITAEALCASGVGATVSAGTKSNAPPGTEDSEDTGTAADRDRAAGDAAEAGAAKGSHDWGKELASRIATQLSV